MTETQVTDASAKTPAAAIIAANKVVGILALMVVEIGLVHPPVGMNVFIINRLAKDVPLVETFKGVVPFLISDFLRIALLLAFPAISLVLVHSFQT